MISMVRRAVVRGQWRAINDRTARLFHIPSPPLFARVTDVDLFNDDTPNLVIEGYSSNGFEVNGVTSLGAQIIFPDLLLLWDVETVDDITSESLSSVIYACPKVDLLLLGTGKTIQSIDTSLLARMHECGVTVDVMATAHACQTFNVLNQEGRRVAAAVLPMEHTQRVDCVAATFS